MRLCCVEALRSAVYIPVVNRIDRYILREHLGPFLFALFVITLVLIVDFIPNVVSMVVSKGLSTGIILQVFVLNLAWMLALSVPMATLSGTLMAFSRMSADSEILALTAAGVPLYRLLAPVLVIAALIAGGLVIFNNDVLPDANHRARLLMSDIRRKRPTLELRPNVLEDRIPGYHLLIKQIDPKSSAIADVTIFDHKNPEAPRTVVAKRGNMRYSEDGKTLILDLYEGEIHESDPEVPGRYRRTGFEKQTFYLGGVADELSRTSSQYRTDREKSAARMRRDIEVWRAAMAPNYAAINQACSTMVAALFLEPPDSTAPVTGLPVVSETFQPVAGEGAARRRARERARRIGDIIQRERASIANQHRLINQYRIEINKKYSIPAACIVFVLIGGPLGIRSRRRGMAAGLAVSLVLFLIYWASLIGGEDLADRGLISPVWAMWAADILIGLVGVVLLWSSSNEVSLSPHLWWGRVRRATGGIRPRPEIVP